MRREILRLRNDPTANAIMAGAFTQANAAYLTQKLGRPPSEGELYIAHFLGAGGAARLIGLAAGNPNAKATDFFAPAAQANPSIFFDKTGAARSIGAVRDVLTARYDVARLRPPNSVSTAVAANVAPPLSIVPDTAGIASAYAAAAPAPPPAPVAPDTQMFHGLFADHQRGPVGAVVSQLWGVPNSAANPLSAASHSPASGATGILDLFTDPVKGT